MLDVLRIAVGEPGIDDLQLHLVGVEPEQPHVAVHQFLAADQDGVAQPLGLEGVGGADDARLLALREDDALALAAHHRAGNLLQEGRGRI
ncbi:hypothetical protein D3C83_26970 [compost metagenome]